MADAGSEGGVLDGVVRLTPRARLGLGIAIAALAAVLVASWLWSRTHEWRVLYSNLNDRDGGAIVAQLSQMNVPYKIADGGGAIMVPSQQVHDTRLRLASQGLPKGSIVGFELLETQKLGATQFQEQVNFQRGLEGELARTIQSLSAVQGARVHLALPKPTVFMRDRQKPSASVLLALHPGRALDRAQIAGIVNLVSSSVPDLPVKNVTVVDQTGAMLSQPAESQGGLDAAQLAYVGELESNYTRRIQEILEPVLGRQNVRAQVTVEVDFAQAETSAETFKPNGDPKDAAVRSQVTSEAGDGSARGPTGVPGATSNAPGAAPAATPTPGATMAGATKRDATVQYEIDKTVRVVRHASGAVKRLSAAIVVNHRKVVAGGKTTWEPIKEEELAKLTALAREAVGFSKDRGDSVNVVNAAFAVDEREAPAEVPLWKQPENIAIAIDLGKQALIACLVLFLAFGVLRPVLRTLATPVAPPAGALADGTAAVPGEPGALPAPAAHDPVAAARAIAKQDPKVVAAVVKNWVAGKDNG